MHMPLIDRRKLLTATALLPLELTSLCNKARPLA